MSTESSSADRCSARAYRDQGRGSLLARDPWTAVGYLRAGLRLDFEDAGLHALLGQAYDQLDQPDAAVRCFELALRFGGEEAALELQIARATSRAGRPREAVRHWCRQIARHGEAAASLSGLGLALSNIGKMRWAADLTSRAVRLAPLWAGAHGNHGIVLYRQHDLDAALRCFERALDLSPGDPVARYHISLVHLTRGDYRRGFADFAAHLQLWAPRFRSASETKPPRPGQTVVLRAHNGLGDTLQFVRYVPRIAAAGVRVLLVVQQRLRWLLAGVQGAERVLDDHDAVPAHDAVFSLLELPRLFDDTLETVAADSPYLHADRTLVERWATRLAPDSNLRVGLAWRGNPEQRDGLYRSCPLAELAPLGNVPGVSFYSLQLGAGEELASCPAGLKVHDLSCDLDRESGPFMDTAAVLMSLDLLISVDTSLCHLGGALGRPVWLLLSDWADWRWLLDIQHSPWYPTMRLFRQPRPFDWASVMHAVRTELDRRSAALRRDRSRSKIHPHFS